MTPRTCAASLAFVLAATAAPAADLRLGLVGAVNFADLDIDVADEDEITDFQTLTRWGAGGVLEVGLTDNLSLVALPMYLGKGAKLEEGGFEARIELGYVEIPLLLKYSFGAEGLRPFVAAGPSLGFREKAEAVVSGLGEEEREDVEDEFKSTDFSLWLGAGLEIPAGGARAFVEGGYALGLTEVDDEPEGVSVKTRGFQVRAGVTFGL